MVHLLKTLIEFHVFDSVFYNVLGEVVVGEGRGGAKLHVS